MDDIDPERLLEGITGIGNPATGVVREALRAWVEHVASYVACDMKVDDVRARVEVGLAMIPVALQQVYDLAPPEAAVVKMGLVVGEDGVLALPGGQRLPIRIGDMFAKGAAATSFYAREIDLMDPKLTLFASSLISFMLRKRWSDVFVESPTMGVLSASEEAAAFLEIGVELAMEDCDPMRLAHAIAMGGLETYPEIIR